MDRYLFSNVSHIVGLQKVTAQTVEARVREAIQRMQIAASDSYDNVSVWSIYWESDDTGGAEDSSLFIQTLSKLQNVQSCQRRLSDGVTLGGFLHDSRIIAPEGELLNVQSCQRSLSDDVTLLL